MGLKMTDTSKAAIAAVVEGLGKGSLTYTHIGGTVYSAPTQQHREAASLISALEAERDTLKQINANLMGDDENVPRYTTRRLKQEIARHMEAAAFRKGRQDD